MKNLINENFIVILFTIFYHVSFSQTTSKKVTFPKGKTGTTVKGIVKGYETKDYTFELVANQTFIV